MHDYCPDKMTLKLNIQLPTHTHTLLYIRNYKYIIFSRDRIFPIIS